MILPIFGKITFRLFNEYIFILDNGLGNVEALIRNFEWYIYIMPANY